MLWAELWRQLGVASEGGRSLFPMGNKLPKCIAGVNAVFESLNKVY